MNNKSLTVRLTGGLCSRICSLVAAIAYTKERAMNLCVNWPEEAKTLNEENGKFKCHLSELWTGDFTTTNKWSSSYLRNTTPESPTGDVFVSTIHPTSFRPENLSMTLGQAFWTMIPSESLRWQYERVQWPSGSVIGVHIRKHHAQPQAECDKWYCERMSQIHSVRPDMHFFLSCDSKSTSDAIRGSVGNVFEREKDYRYDKMGIIGSAADLYLLGKCDWIIGSTNSSYSQFASWVQDLGPDPKQWKSAVPKDFGPMNWPISPCYEDGRTEYAKTFCALHGREDS